MLRRVSIYVYPFFINFFIKLVVKLLQFLLQKGVKVMKNVRFCCKITITLDYESDALTPSSPDKSGCAGQATELWA